MMLLFFIGIVEMLIATLWTALVTKAKVLASGFVTFINIFIWYYVLETVIKDINNWQLIVIYAFGCAIGTIIGTWIFSWLENNKEQVLGKWKTFLRKINFFQKKNRENI